VGRQVPETTDFVMSSTSNHHRRSPVWGSPMPIDGSLCSHIHEPSNARVGVEWWTTQPVRAAQIRGPLHRFGPMTATLRRIKLCPPLPPRSHYGAWMVLIWSAGGACVLNAWGEPPGVGGGCNRRVLACMGVARFCVCPVHTNAREVHSMARHEL